MSVLDQWNHRWFGYWYEYGPAYKLCPHIREFVFPQVVQKYEKPKVISYLRGAQVVAATSRMSYPCPFTGKRIAGSIRSMTDGEWHWLDDLCEYIEQHNVAIPTAMLVRMQSCGYRPPPPVGGDVIARLERPVLS